MTRKVLQPGAALFVAMLLLCGGVAAQKPIAAPPKNRPAKVKHDDGVNGTGEQKKTRPEKPIAPTVVYELTVDGHTAVEADADADGGMDYFTVQTNAKQWRCYSNVEWLKPTANRDRVALVVEKNQLQSERSGVVYITAEPDLKATITVTQAGKAMFEVNGHILDFDLDCPDYRGCKNHIPVKCNSRWTIEGRPQWIRVEYVKGGFNLVFNQNTGGYRTGVVVVKSGNRIININVSQRGK